MKTVPIESWECLCLYLEDLLDGSATKSKGIYTELRVIAVEDGDKTAIYARLKDGRMVKLLYVW